MTKTTHISGLPVTLYHGFSVAPEKTSNHSGLFLDGRQGIKILDFFRENVVHFTSCYAIEVV